MSKNKNRNKNKDIKDSTPKGTVNKSTSIDRKKIMQTNDLSDSLWKLEAAMKKSFFVVEKDILTNYFRKYDKNIAEHRIGISWEFDHHKIYAEIVSDYIAESLEILKEVRSSVDESRALEKNTA